MFVCVGTKVAKYLYVHPHKATAIAGITHCLRSFSSICKNLTGQSGNDWGSGLWIPGSSGHLRRWYLSSVAHNCAQVTAIRLELPLVLWHGWFGGRGSIRPVESVCHLSRVEQTEKESKFIW